MSFSDQARQLSSKIRFSFVWAHAALLHRPAKEKGEAAEGKQKQQVSPQWRASLREGEPS